MYFSDFSELSEKRISRRFIAVKRKIMKCSMRVFTTEADKPAGRSQRKSPVLCVFKKNEVEMVGQQTRSD
jgi:hypothetical protein